MRAALIILGYLLSTAAYGYPAPSQMQDYCKRSPHLCVAGYDIPLVYTDELMTLLRDINYRINRHIRYRLDPGKDVWHDTGNIGDCDEYVMQKRRVLIEKGLNPAALRVSMVITETDEYHAVLLVKTTRDDLVLDNRKLPVMTVKESGYRWIQSSTADPMIWNAGR